MKIVTDPKRLRAELDALRVQGMRIGFVPTMGYLHDGHASLMRASRAATDATVVSIFVNPLQFGANEDLDRYPRDPARDDAICSAEGVGLVFRPDVASMYDAGPPMTIDVGALGTVLEGASRPGHFNGVATVVAKLFNIVGACTAFFGEKDAQQLVVIRRLVEAFDIPVEIVGCPTIREPDGLAMSSRNKYLDPAEREAAVVISKTLFEARDLIEAGERDAGVVVARAWARIAAEPLATVDHVAAVDPRTLEPVTTIVGPLLIVAAAKIGATRLIDNVTVPVLPVR